MNYTFLSTRSCNYVYDVYYFCEYGFVATDELFGLTADGKQDILVFPGKGRNVRFDQKPGNDHPELTLGHPKEAYLSAPTFDDVYDDLASLLDSEKGKIFLWSAKREILVLLHACSWNRYPRFEFVGYDVQKIYASLLRCDHAPSLEEAAKELGIPTDGLLSHRPDEDAWVMMRILETLCQRSGRNVDELIADCPDCRLEAIQTENEHDRETGKKFREELARKRLDPAYQKEEERRVQYHVELSDLWERYGEDNDLCDSDRLFIWSPAVERNGDKTIPLIKKWLTKGFRIECGSSAKYIVIWEDEDKETYMWRFRKENVIVLTVSEFDKLVENF